MIKVMNERKGEYLRRETPMKNKKNALKIMEMKEGKKEEKMFPFSSFQCDYGKGKGGGRKSVTV